MSLGNYGFIITRHVKDEITNRYWNHCIKCIRRFYPYKKIIVIDDNSDQEFVVPEFEYKNVEILKSEFPGRGELLPYYYFYKKKYFENAVILHDSVFFHKRIMFEKIKSHVMPLWHFEYNENAEHSLFLCTVLKNSEKIKEKIKNDTTQSFAFNCSNAWYGCFGVQSYINHTFLCLLEKKYNLFNLLTVVKNRTDRCSLERIMGAIFYTEHPSLYKRPSLLGNIWKYCVWGTNYAQYYKNFRRNIKLPLVKVWTGR